MSVSRIESSGPQNPFIVGSANREHQAPADNALFVHFRESLQPVRSVVRFQAVQGASIGQPVHLGLHTLSQLPPAVDFSARSHRISPAT